MLEFSLVNEKTKQNRLTPVSMSCCFSDVSFQLWMIILYIALNPDTYIHTCTNMQSAERVIKKKNLYGPEPVLSETSW